jgi:hypothetical protein
MLTLLCSAAPLSAAPPETVEAGWVLQKIARPAPVSTGFVELRGSALLKTPLRLEGRYARPDKDTLVREVTAPYHETTTIRGGEATLEREGKAKRTFSLSRVPELAGLQRSFGALLAGDQAQLEQHYTITAAGPTAQWRLTLLPKDAELSRQVRQIQLYGRGAELRCIETSPVKGDLQRTLLAGAARDAAGVTELTALIDLCRGALP